MQSPGRQNQGILGQKTQKQHHLGWISLQINSEKYFTLTTYTSTSPSFRKYSRSQIQHETRRFNMKTAKFNMQTGRTAPQTPPKDPHTDSLQYLPKKKPIVQGCFWLKTTQKTC
jgi:hypothetical protein